VIDGKKVEYSSEILYRFYVDHIADPRSIYGESVVFTNVYGAA
jgi:hypothetical protein